jgi:hypothetical protein|nr:S24/S26 family peptidase [uncultured Porphyromonas sp.]
MSDTQRTDTRRSSLVVGADEFFREILSRLASGKRVKIRAKGSSMLPLIRDTRDTIVLSALSEDSIQVGRLLLVRIPQGYALHRVERIEGHIITLRGDGNPYQREQCTPDQVLAEATAILRGKKVIELGSRLWWCYEHLWPKHNFIRRLCLALYRRTLLRWGY